MRPATLALDHVLDAQAANAHEHRMLHDPSPEVDSLVEYTAAIRQAARKLPDGPARARLLVLADAAHGRTRAIIVQNARERTCEREAAGALDLLADRMIAPSLKRLAADLRPLLGATGGTAYVRLVCRVRDLLASPLVGRDVLLGDGLAHELGGVKRGTAHRLRSLVADIEAVQS